MTDLTTADIERLLRDSGSEVDYPPTPDIAGRALDRLRLATPDRIGSVGLIASPPPHVSRSQATTQPIPLKADRLALPGQLVRMAAAILAFVCAGGLLIAIFGLASDSDDDRHGAPATGTGVQDRLYVLTEHGTFTAYDEATHEAVYSLDVAYASQAAISPDGARIYLMTPATDSNISSLIAVNAVNGSLIWRAPQTMSPVGYINDGPPSMALSADGTRLYLYMSRRNGDTFLGYSIRSIDTNTGSTIGEAEATDGPNSGCSPQLQASQSNGRIFLTCWAGDRLRIFDLGMARFTYDINLPARNTIGSAIQSTDSIAGAAQSPDGRYLYVVSDGPRINVINTGPGELESTHDIPSIEPARVHRGLVALSDDGTRLAIGVQTVSHDNGLGDIGRIIVVDIATWQPVADVSLDPAIHDPPMTGHAMTFSRDGSALYVSETVYEDGTVNVVESSSVVRIDIVTGEREVVVETDDGDQVWRVFTGSVADSPQRADPEPDDAPISPVLLVDEYPERPAPAPLRLSPVDPVTLHDIPGHEPIPFGHHFTQAYSPDRQTLAAITWPSDTGAGGSLNLIDLATWSVTVTPVSDLNYASGLTFADDGRSLYWVSGDYFATGVYELYRYNIAGQSVSRIVDFPERFAPHQFRVIGDNRIAAYGVPTDSGNLNAGDPRVMVVNTDDGTIVVDVTLGGIKAWQYREEPEDDNEYPVRIYDPGIAWDTERELLYIVHAETDSVTVVNLETGATTTTEYAPRQSLTGKLLDWLVPAAAASPVPHTSRIAVLSPDGQSLFVAGTADHWNKEPGTNWNDGWPEELSWTGLQVLDTSNLSESRTIDLPPISGMTLSPDGSRLILQTFTHGQVDNGQSVRENQQIVALAADDLRQLGAIDIPGEYTIHGFSADGAHLYVSERLFIDEIPSIDLLVIDLDTWTATVARTLDDTWFGELVVPVE